MHSYLKIALLTFRKQVPTLGRPKELPCSEISPRRPGPSPAVPGLSLACTLTLKGEWGQLALYVVSNSPSHRCFHQEVHEAVTCVWNILESDRTKAVRAACSRQGIAPSFAYV